MNTEERNDRTEGALGCLRASIYDVRVRTLQWYAKSRQKEQNQLISVCDKGDGGKQSETFADVIYGSPLLGHLHANTLTRMWDSSGAAANIYRSHSLVLAVADNISMHRSQSVWWNMLGKHLNWSTAPLIFLCVARRLQPQNRVSSRHNFQLGRALSTMDYSAHRILWLSNIVTCNDVLLVVTIFIAIGNILS